MIENSFMGLPGKTPGGALLVDVETDRILRIVRETAKRFGLEASDLRGHSRRAYVSWARHVAMWLARRLVGASYPIIGHAFFGRHHTTVMSAVRKIDRRRKRDVAWASELLVFEQELRR